jgi:hypothetical protein
MKAIGIVSGNVRSGTSAAMRVFRDAGFSILEDNHRIPDESNPLGYHEFSRVQGLRNYDASWLSQAEGSIVKILPVELIYTLPITHQYQVIFMIRDCRESAESFYKMLFLKGKVRMPKSDFVERWSHRMFTARQNVSRYMEMLPQVFSVLRVEQSLLDSSSELMIRHMRL